MGRRPDAVRIELLGGFRVTVGSRVVGEDTWRLRKAAALVKLLALEPNHRLHKEQAMDLPWPHLGARAAANNLHRTLYAARRVLEPRLPAADSRHLRLRGEQLELCPGALWVDVGVFEEAAAKARRLRDPAAYRVAADLYAGELLPADRYEAWAEDRWEGLRQQYISLLLEIAGLQDDDGQAIEALSRLVAEQPSHEGAHAGLMRLYARGGRREEALERYGRLRRALGQDFAEEPGAASRRLRDEILAGNHLPTRQPNRRGARRAGYGRRDNLPVTRTSFVGRDSDLVGLKRALAMTQLLTLTAAGGCWKTRLALEASGDFVGAYSEGVWLVELAEFSDPSLVAQRVAETLGVRGQPGRPLAATLTDALREKEHSIRLRAERSSQSTGVGISDIGTTGNRVMGNFIGTTKSGTGDLGNAGRGVFVGNGAADNIVGDVDFNDGFDNAANVIAFSGLDGVDISGAASTSNSILGNSIFSNARLGITLGQNPNDGPGDADTGPNGLQNSPRIGSAKTGRKFTTITGTLESTPNGAFIVQYRSNSKGTREEGKKLLGTQGMTTGNDGVVPLAFQSRKVEPGFFVTATATRATTGDTSSFRCRER